MKSNLVAVFHDRRNRREVRSDQLMEWRKVEDLAEYNGGLHELVVCELVYVDEQRGGHHELLLSDLVFLRLEAKADEDHKSDPEKPAAGRRTKRGSRSG